MKKDFTEVTDEDFQKIMLTNVESIFTISREVVKSMINNKKGSIVNISSMASQYGIPKVIAYSASKGAIEAMTRAMAVELSPKGIRVNCIAPGFIATEMSAKALNNDKERKVKCCQERRWENWVYPLISETQHCFWPIQNRRTSQEWCCPWMVEIRLGFDL